MCLEVIKMFDIGRVCVKIAGRDAGMKCIIVDVIDEHYVMIDGQTRRRKCNIKHLEPLSQSVQLNKNAPAAEVIRLLKELDIVVGEKKPKTKAAKAKAEKPRKMHKKKEKPVKEAKVKPSKESKKKTTKVEKTGKLEKTPDKKAEAPENKE
jgi:large subunit ribosomal protein L14e